MSKIVYCIKCGAQLDESAEFCSKCGTRVKLDTLDNNDNQEQKKPKKKVKRMPIILTVVVFVLVLLIGICCYLEKSGYLYENGYQAKIYDTFGICIEHHYKDVTCTEPETCEICGITQGVALGHQWVEATCDKAKTCSICFDTEGEALGHTVLLGKCGNCGEYQYELLDELSTISNYILEGSDKFTSGSSYLKNNVKSGSVYNYYIACSSANNYFVKTKDLYTKAYNACGDYQEFATLKTKIKAVINSIPTSAPQNNSQSCTDYLQKLKDTAEQVKECAEYMSQFIKDVNVE